MSKQDSPPDKGRTMKEVSDDLQNAGFDKNPTPPQQEEPTAPEPKELTPEQMDQHPDAYLNPDNEEDAGSKAPATWVPGQGASSRG